MKHGFVSKSVVLSILLALVFSAVGTAPVRAAGPLSHNEVVRAAEELLPASELKTLLQDHQGAVLSGSVYPDWGLGYAMLTGNDRYKDYAENAHSPEFITAYLNIVRMYSPPYDEYEKQSIAFLFGLIAHKASDDAFHGGFLPVAYQADNGGVEDHGLIEVGVDSFNTVYSVGYNTDWFFPFLEVWSAYMELHDNGIYSYSPPTPEDLILGFETYVGESSAQVTAEYGALVYYYFRLPNTRDLMHDPDVPGSMPNMVTLTKEAWLATWNVFNYTGPYHVKPIASGIGDCLSWENACALQTALSIPYGSNEVWAMGGEYKPTEGSDRAATFQLRYGLSVFGGFAGTEATRDQRDPAANVTTLSGDIDPTGDNDSYHVVKGVTSATLDGFTVTKGNANGASPYDVGGGMYNSGQPIVSNIIFNDNTATRGGGAYNKGGEVYNPQAAAVFTNVTFSHNSATWGGGVYNYLAQPTFTNITFSGNSASQNGGGMANEESIPSITNVTFSGNQATGSGGGMRNDNNSNPQIVNTIFWGNTATTSDPQISNVASAPVVSYSVVQDSADTSNGNTGNDPKLGTLGNYGGFTQTIPLQEGSSAIDAGDDASCPATDQHGLTRPQREHCDIGAFELGVPAVGLSASSHDFGYQEVGTTSGTFTVTLTNTGNDILHVGTLAITGQFTLSGTTCNDTAIFPNGICTFDVTFSPLALGPLSGSITIPSDAVSNPDTVTLNGSGVDTTPPVLTVPANMLVNATSAAGAVVNFTASATDLVDASPTVACIPPSGSTFPLGVTTVNCTATDDSNNVDSDSFTITVQHNPNEVILYYPANTEHTNSVRVSFDWSDYPGATGYQAQFSYSPTLVKPFLYKNIADPISTLIVNHVPVNRTIYWRVRARTGLTYSAWSQIFSFHSANPPSTPRLLKPLNGALISGLSPVFDWANSVIPTGTTFDHYRIQIATDSAFTNIVHDLNINGVANSKDNTALLISGTTYYWRVQAFNSAGDFSTWSVVWRVRIQ